MTVAFHFSAALAVLATLMVVVQADAGRALLYLAVSLLATGVAFFALGAPLAGMLEALAGAGAIAILVVFGSLLPRLEPARSRAWLSPAAWIGPSLLSAMLLVELLAILWGLPAVAGRVPVGAGLVGSALAGPYLLAAGLASLLLFAAAVGARHIRERG